MIFRVLIYLVGLLYICLMFYALLLNLTMSAQGLATDSVLKRVVIGQNDYFQVALHQYSDSIDMRLTNITSDTLRFYLGFFAFDSLGYDVRMDYNVLLHTRPLGGKFATPTLSILPGETVIKRQRIAPKLYEYMLGFSRYDWFIGNFSRKEKMYQFLLLSN